MRRPLVLSCLLLLASAPAAAAADSPPRERGLASGWEVRVEPADPAAPQPPPPEETAPAGVLPNLRPTPPGRAAQAPGQWRPTRVPSVFDTRALASLFPGQVRRYRIAFTGPDTPRGFRWLLEFESVRRAATVYLNGRRLGRNADPYTPFSFEARGLRPGARNELVVVVDGRKNPKLPEAWWNWNGIVRPVRLVPAGSAHLAELGTLSEVSCRGPASGCRASLLLDAQLERSGRDIVEPTLDVELRAPSGRRSRKRFVLPKGRAGERARPARDAGAGTAALVAGCPAALQRPAHAARRRSGRAGRAAPHRAALGDRQGRPALPQQPPHPAARRVHPRGHARARAPRSRAADMDRIVADLKSLGANVTRAHYLMNDALLSRLDRAGIMVWSQAPIWQRDAGAHLLWQPRERERALETVRRTVTAARSHPSVLTHSVANELTFTPDRKPGTKRFLLAAQEDARDLDPTLPISVDIKGRPGFPEQFTLHAFDMIGLNQYFGWYPWVEDFTVLEPYIYELRDHYPAEAIVMTEWGAEARPELSTAGLDRKGGYAFQDMHAARTLDVIDRSPVLSGAIYWTLREFEIYPGWMGGAGRRPPSTSPTPATTRAC